MKMAKFFKLLFFLFLFALFFSPTALASTVEKDLAECEQLFAKGQESRAAQNYIQALEFYTKAEVLAERLKLKDKLYDIKTSIGIVYHMLSNYGEALGAYQEALDLAEKSGSEEKIVKILNNIGLLYHYEKDYKNAIVYYNKAYKYEGYTKYCIAVNMADAYNNLGDYAKGRKYLLEVEKMPAELYLVQMWKINYAEGLFLEGNIDKARLIVEKQLTDIKLNCYYCAVELLVRIYAAQGNVDKAIYFAKKGLQNEEVLLERSKLYNHLFKLYLKKKDYETSILYKDSIMQAKDSITSKINRGLYESNKVKMKVQEYQNEITSTNEKRGIERNFFIAIFICGVVIFFSIYRGLKNKIIYQKQQKTIADGNEKILNLELQKKKKENLLIEKQLESVKNRALLKQERLKNEISEKNRKLSAKALFLSGRNELIEEVINSLSQIPDINKNEQASNYLKTLKNYLRTNEEWEEFAEHFEKVNPGLLKTLKKKHPELTVKDIRFLCYVYMNLDTKELATVFNITPDACRRRERRLLEKMNLSKDSSLFEYLLTVSN